MRAVAFREYGGPEVLEVLELPDPEPGPGQVRIRVAAMTRFLPHGRGAQSELLVLDA